MVCKHGIKKNDSESKIYREKTKIWNEKISYQKSENKNSDNQKSEIKNIGNLKSEIKKYWQSKIWDQKLAEVHQTEKLFTQTGLRRRFAYADLTN